MAIVLIVATVAAVIVWYFDLLNPLPTPHAASASDLDPQAPERAICSAANPHSMVLSELGTWWYCEHDGCDELWPADEVHHAIDLPYDREAVQLVDEAEQFLRRVS